MQRPLTMSLAVGLGVLAVLGTAPATPAAAAFPGANGRLAFQRFDAAGTALGDIYTVTASGKGETDLTGTPAVEDRDPAWSADGTRIALRRYGAGPDELWVMNADGSGLTVVPGSGTASAPAWSPGGGTLVYECWSGGRTDICSIAPDGTGLTHLTSTAGVDEHTPVWSPNGLKIAFVRDGAAGGSNLLTLSVKTLGTTVVTTAVAGTYDSGPDWSPDGTQLAFGRFVAGSGYGTGIYRVPAAGGRATLVTRPLAGSDSHHTMPAWSPDGTRIAYCDLDDDEAWGHIFTIKPDGTGNTQVTFGPQTDEAPDWRPV
ncbi:TolB family protein [Dactylosporangium sp. CA-139114]|uniref:TolB family protein n=1 Tax=Dactylosporangium sp. CA-139114 TaxID=3239931 RepID=UPI003D9694F8